LNFTSIEARTIHASTIETNIGYLIAIRHFSLAIYIRVANIRTIFVKLFSKKKIYYRITQSIRDLEESSRIKEGKNHRDFQRIEENWTKKRKKEV